MNVNEKNDVDRSSRNKNIRKMTDEDSLTSTRSFVSDDDETSRRTPSSLNNYSILPPIRSATNDDEQQSNEFLKHLQEKYQNNDRNGSSRNFVKFSFRFVEFQRN